MSESSEIRSGRHVVFQLTAHLVFVPKYRRGVISAEVFAVLRAAWEKVCADFGATLNEAGFEADHVHLLVSYPPKVALSALVNSLKGVSARRLRAANLPEVTRALWGDHFWSPSYCAVSCGGAPLEIVKQYVNNQHGARLLPSLEGGVSATAAMIAFGKENVSAEARAELHRATPGTPARGTTWQDKAAILCAVSPSVQLAWSAPHREWALSGLVLVHGTTRSTTFTHSRIDALIDDVYGIAVSPGGAHFEVQTSAGRIRKVKLTPSAMATGPAYTWVDA